MTSLLLCYSATVRNAFLKRGLFKSVLLVVRNNLPVGGHYIMSGEAFVDETG